MIMKRLVLLFAGLLIGLTTASATEQNIENTDAHFKKNKHSRLAQPIVFIERGVEFLIFPDGSFDFNTNIDNNYYNDIYYKNNSRRSNINVAYRGPNVNIQYSNARLNRNRGVSIIRDRNGMVRRIGNVFLNYDRVGRITRAGSVFMSYNRGRHSNLSRVGNLRVNYNRWGEIINTRGQVNRFNDNCNFCGTLSCDVDHRHGNRHRNNNDWDDRRNVDRFDDDNYYYYKQNGKVKKQKKNKR